MHEVLDKTLRISKRVVMFLARKREVRGTSQYSGELWAVRITKNHVLEFTYDDLNKIQANAMLNIIFS